MSPSTASSVSKEYLLHYAVNVADLATRDTMTGPYLVAPVTANQVVVETKRDEFAGNALVLECDEERAAAIIAVIRLKHPRNVMRCYTSKTGRGGWKRV